MPITDTTEKRFESDIESFLVSAAGGYTKTTDRYDPQSGLYVNTLITFIQRTQPREWKRFEKIGSGEPVKQFVAAFNNACEMNGLVYVLRNGFKHRGITFRVCYFRPESGLNQMTVHSTVKISATASVSGIMPRITKIPWIWCWCLTVFP